VSGVSSFYAEEQQAQPWTGNWVDFDG
jgi:hypothetical protein